MRFLCSADAYFFFIINIIIIIIMYNKKLQFAFCAFQCQMDISQYNFV